MALCALLAAGFALSTTLMLRELSAGLPAPAALAAQVAGGLALALASVAISALFPVLRISQMEPAQAMRE